MNEKLRSSPILQLGVIIMAVMATACVPLSGYFLFQKFLEARANAQWPAVPGVVTHAAVVPTGTALDRKYHAEVSYDYSVAGINHSGNRIRTSSQDWSDFSAARDELGTLAPNVPVMVHYDPADPSQCLLKPGVGFQELAFLYVPLIMLAFGMGMWWLLLGDFIRRKIRRISPPALPPTLPVQPPGADVGRWN